MSIRPIGEVAIGFQFQLGTIGTFGGAFSVIDSMLFQFQLGTIGTYDDAHLPRMSAVFQFQLGTIGTSFANNV